MGKDPGDNPQTGQNLDQALAEALQSVEKYERPRKSSSQADPAEAEETLVQVQIEPDPDAGPEQQIPLDPGTEAGPELLERLKAELEKARQEARETHDRMLRVAADADNIRKRALKERQEAIKYGLEGILRDLLPVVDNIERTLAHVPSQVQDPALGALREGVEMVLRQFLAVLESHTVQAIESLGQPFDPAKHEALNRQETDQADPGTVISELHRGYLLHDRLLRPALVTVACAPQGSQPDGAAGEPDPQQSSPEPAQEAGAPSRPVGEDS